MQKTVPATLARRRFGYSATAVAAALGYHGPSSVGHAVKRIKTGPDDLKETPAEIQQMLE